MPRVGKFFILFSRPGKRVIIDYRGDVVVRPSPYEIFIRSGELPIQSGLFAYLKCAQTELLHAKPVAEIVGSLQGAIRGTTFLRPTGERSWASVKLSSQAKLSR